MNNSESKVNPVEKLRLLSCQLFNTVPALSTVELPESLKLAWVILARTAGVTPKVFLKEIANSCGMDVSTSLRSDSGALKLLPEAFARLHLVLPLSVVKGVSTIVIGNPCDDELQEQLTFAAKGRVKFLLAPPEDIDEAIHVNYSSVNKTEINTTNKLVIQAKNANDHDDSAIINLAQGIIEKAVSLGSSDLHIQPYSGGGTVRVRVDSMLRRITLLPENVYLQLCRYFKAHSGMDSSNSRIAQDGRLSLDLKGRYFDLRVSSLPARGGERIVIRFLDQTKNFKLSGNGFSVTEIQSLRRLTGNSSGLILITGPTGSGKTTTLYALLEELNTVYRNIITVENPVEYTLSGLSQVEVNERAGLTFASVLKSVLRQDPDVILIGEIRDEETAQIAFQAALTGHLVFSTLHSNDSISSIPRLLDLGVKPSIISDSLIGVVSQRLCRRLCHVCRTPVEEPLLKEESAFKSATKIAPIYRVKGCETCGYTGYSGRIPITEILETTGGLRDAIHSGEINTWVSEHSEFNSLLSMSSSVIRHIMSGDTTIKEASRVLGRRFWTDLSSEFNVEIDDMAILQNEGEETDAPGILIIGQNDNFEQALISELKNSWFDVYQVESSGKADELMKVNDNIVFAIANLNEDSSNEELVTFIRLARADLAWTRIPALLLLPDQNINLERELREDGATSPCMIKPVPVKDVIHFIANAITEKGQK